MAFSRTLRYLVPLLALAAWPDPAFGKLPSPPNCTVPDVITLVGRDEFGMPDARGEFTVTVQDVIGLPIHGAIVFIDFAPCGDARICSDQSPTATAMCSYRYVADVEGTDANGVAHLRVVGHADHACAPTTGALARVYADGVLLKTVRVAAYDHDGNGVGPSDLSLWLADYFTSGHPARADYDGDGAVGPADLSLWMGAFFASGSVAGGGAVSCP